MRIAGNAAAIVAAIIIAGVIAYAIMWLFW